MHLFPSLALTILLPLAVVAAPPANLDNEYDQVRAIASRDPKVKAAFEKANERLDEKIVEIDPALRGYVKGRPQTNGTPVATPKPKPRTATPHATTHTIATGDTLSTIAAHYKVTVSDLKAANPSVNEKKLQVMEKLVIPSHK